MKARLVQSEFVRSVSTDGGKAKSYIKLWIYENGVNAIEIFSYFIMDEIREVGYIDRNGEVLKTFKGKALRMRGTTLKIDTLNSLVEKLQEAQLNKNQK
jgi:hypothetical protein